MPHQFTLTRRVEFADTDAAGVAHFACFFRYMEEAEHAFYRSLGLSAYRWTPDGVDGMPRVSAHCDFSRPLRYDDLVDVQLIVREKRAKSLEYEVVFSKRGEEPPREVARGGMRVVFVTRRHGTREWTPAELPAELAQRVEVAPGGSESRK